MTIQRGQCQAKTSRSTTEPTELICLMGISSNNRKDNHTVRPLCGENKRTGGPCHFLGTPQPSNPATRPHDCEKLLSMTRLASKCSKWCLMHLLLIRTDYSRRCSGLTYLSSWSSSVQMRLFQLGIAGNMLIRDKERYIKTLDHNIRYRKGSILNSRPPSSTP